MTFSEDVAVEAACWTLSVKPSAEDGQDDEEELDEDGENCARAA